jgi:hypothetical protein
MLYLPSHLLDPWLTSKGVDTRVFFNSELISILRGKRIFPNPLNQLGIFTSIAQGFWHALVYDIVELRFHNAYLEPIEPLLSQWLTLGENQQRPRQIRAEVIEVRWTRVRTAPEVDVVREPKQLLAILKTGKQWTFKTWNSLTTKFLDFGTQTFETKGVSRSEDTERNSQGRLPSRY